MQPSDRDRKRWGEQIATARTAKELSQPKLAQLVDLHPQTISDTERGIARISEATYKRIAVAVGLDPSELLSSETEEVA
jgi:transcriptional regulator with XRE-family HTH domain